MLVRAVMIFCPPNESPHLSELLHLARRESYSFEALALGLHLLLMQAIEDLEGT